ncbi:MAG: GH25 family lysozyme [Lachnospiraceae bacterium]|nr:GH25 family lysozyme [Lachnospiraceae bacterium]
MNKWGKKVIAFVLAGMMAFAPVNYVQAAGAGNAIAKGIDVSKHNGAIDWSSVPSSGISFAFIKAGSTKSGVDPYFDANMRGAQNAGLKVGVYLYSYATTVEQAQNEANLLLGWLSNYTVTFPVVYDVEDSCHKGMSQEQLQALINTFCSTVSAAGYYPMVYSSKNWFNQRIGNVGYDKWVAQYADNLEYNGASFWQCTSHGSVAGVGTRVDINYQFKDFSSLIISDGFVDRNGQTLFFAGYKMQRGWVAYNDTRYYLDANGFLQRNCWFADESGTYYLTADGSVARGQVSLDGQNYYFDGNGVRNVGWVTIEDKKYYYAPDTGVMVHGWFEDETGKYFLATKDGHMLVSDVTIEGKDYYFAENGVMQVGLVTKPDGKQYFYDETGALVRNSEVTVDGVLYQTNKNGVAAAVPVEAPQPVETTGEGIAAAEGQPAA